MMNLELLFYASRATGDPSFRDIAVSHARHTMMNQVRDDYSCFHIVYYDKETGKPIKGETSQGYSDNSAWSRGQAWGIYGFTMCYRETKDPSFLTTAQRMADFYLDHPNLPSDKVAWWDFNANQPGYVPGVRSNANNVVLNYRDASAAACTASALLELSTYSEGKLAKKYLEGSQGDPSLAGQPPVSCRTGQERQLYSDAQHGRDSSERGDRRSADLCRLLFSGSALPLRQDIGRQAAVLRLNLRRAYKKQARGTQSCREKC